MSEKTPYPIFDCDNHFYEPAEAFLRHLPKKYSKAFQYIEVRGRTKLAIDNLISDYIPNPTFDVVAGPGSHELYYRAKNTEGKSLRELVGDDVVKCKGEWRDDKEAKLASMDDFGLYGALMFPTLASVIEERIDNHKVVNALMHSLNEWIFEEWGFDTEGRIFGVPVINLMNVDMAVKELEQVLERGARTVLVRPAPVKREGGSCSFGLTEFDPFWARINEAGIFVSLHSSDSGYDEFVRNWEGGYEMRPFEATSLKAVIDIKDRAIFDTIAALICHGVFDRHPKVKVAAVETGSSWVALLLEKFRIAYGKVPQTFSRHPSETFREHFYVSPFYEDDLYALSELIGVDHILFGSDYPHAEGLAEPLAYLEEVRDFSEGDKQKVMSTNLKTLLNA